MRCKTYAVIGGAVAMLMGGGCSESSTPSAGELRVVTTVAPLQSIVASVAGERVSVCGLVPGGVDSHTYNPPPSAAEVLAEADVVFVNGLGLEESTRELADRVKPSDAPLVELGTTVLPESAYIYDFAFPKVDGSPNPHLWTDPTYVIEYAELIRDTLAELDPSGAGTYVENFDAFVEKVELLIAALRTDQQTVAQADRKLVTYHDGFAYFARSFGWRVIGAIQPSDFREPTVREVMSLIEQIEHEEVRAIFGSEVFPSSVLEQVGRSTGVRHFDTLSDDELPGAPEDVEHSWLGLMRTNLVTMIEALGGEASMLRALDLAETGISHVGCAE